MAAPITSTDIVALYRELAKVRKARGDMAGAVSALQSVHTLRVSSAARCREKDTLSKRIGRMAKVTRPATLPKLPESRLTVSGTHAATVLAYASL